MKKIVWMLLGLAGAWLAPLPATAQNQPFTINFHNNGTLGVKSFRIYVAGNCQSSCWNAIVGGNDPCNGPSPEIPAGGMVTWVINANYVGQTVDSGITHGCSGGGIWSDNTQVTAMSGVPFVAGSGATYDIYLYGGNGGGSSGNPSAPVNFKGCLTVNNTSSDTVYGYLQQELVDSGGVHDVNISGCGSGGYLQIPPGQSFNACDSSLSTTLGNVQNGATASLKFVQVSGGTPCDVTVGLQLAGACVPLCGPEGMPFSPTASAIIGVAPELPVSTNGAGSGTGGSGMGDVAYTDTGVLYQATNNPIPFSSSTNQASIDMTGFDALYDVSVKQLSQLQLMGKNQLAEAAGIISNATTDANAINAANRTNFQSLQNTMAGLSNTIAQWGSGSGGSNGPIVWTEPAAMSNQLGAIQTSTALIVTNMGQLISNNLANGGYLADFSNGLGQLHLDLTNNEQQGDSNTAYLAAISNNTVQPNLYTNADFGSKYPTNPADIGTMGSNQTAGVSGSLQGFGDTLTAQANDMNGNGPGGDGSIFTVQADVPGPAGGTVTYTFDLNPMDYPTIVDLASFVRQAFTWMVGIGVLLKMIGDISGAVGQMMSTAQGQVPKVEILGNTTGWALAGVYLVGIVAAMVGLPLFLATYLTSAGFGPTLWQQIQTNPFSPSGYGSAMLGALWLADKFAPLYFVVSTALYYTAFRFYLVRLITIVAAVVRAFMA